MRINLQPNAKRFRQVNQFACEPVKVALKIIRKNFSASRLAILNAMCIQQFHSTVQVELLNKIAINSNKLTYGTFSFLHNYKNAYRFKT